MRQNTVFVRGPEGNLDYNGMYQNFEMIWSSTKRKLMNKVIFTRKTFCSEKAESKSDQRFLTNRLQIWKTSSLILSGHSVVVAQSSLMVPHRQSSSGKLANYFSPTRTCMMVPKSLFSFNGPLIHFLTTFTICPKTH